MSFHIYPAIDLRNGRVVRLQHGDPDRQTTFSDDPLAVARNWVEAGSAWLHVVNLDGAFNEKGAANWSILPQISKLPVKVQFGGGIRSLKDVGRALDAGAERIVLGTVAIENPDLVREAVSAYGPEHIAVGIDARDGKVRTRGWQEETTVSPVELGLSMKNLGIQTIIYTDISRDGVFGGVNLQNTARLADETGLQLIASGGVADLTDVQACANARHRGIIGVIIGRALYDHRISLADAISLE